MDGRVPGNTAPGGPTSPSSVSPLDAPLTVNTSGLSHAAFVKQPSTPSFASAPSATTSQSGIALTSPASNSSPSPSLISALPTVESIFREYIYRNCRDTLFWIEVERYRQNPQPQKATFILRTFFSEGGEFFLAREDFPPYFETLFSKQRPTSPGALLLEAQDHMKSKLFACLGPSFATGPMMAKLSASPMELMKELTTPSCGGTLAAFLTPRPASTALPGGLSLGGATSVPATPTNAPVGMPTAGTSSVPVTPTGSAPAPMPATVAAAAQPARATSPPPASPHSQQHDTHPRTTSTSPTSPRMSAPGATSPRKASSATSPLSRTAATASGDQPTHPFSSASHVIPPPERARSGFIPASPSSATNFIPSSSSSPHFTSFAPPPVAIAQANANANTNQGGQPLSPSGRAKLIASSPPTATSSSSSNAGVNGNLMNAGSANYSPGERRTLQHRPSVVDETLTSSKARQVQAPTTQMPAKASSSSPRMNMSQLVGAVRDKVGLAKKDKERKEREKYYDPLANGWMFMENPALEDLINDPNMMIIYYDFLRTIHAEENLVAWVDIELYKGSMASREARRNAGVDLLVRYFEPTSKTLINIEGVNYKDILKELNERPARDLFDGAQRVLWDQLAFQCFVRFKDNETVRRILVEETTIKGKKKELLKVAQKALKAHVEALSIFTKLEELSKYKAGLVSFIPNVSEREFQMEDILYTSDLLIAFREYLNTLSNPSEYLDALSFWFEVEVWKYSSKDNFKETALQLLRDYILPPATGGVPRIVIPGMDTKPLELEIQERPDKSTFMRHQVFAWRKLKLEQFGNFESSETINKFLDGNLPMRQMQAIVRHCDTLNDLRAKNANEALFKANAAKVQAKIRVKRQEVQGTNFELEFMLADREYVQILCEFLDKRQARENLAFWTEAEYYKHLASPAEKAMVAVKIWDRFFSDKAEVHINVDILDKTAIQQALKDSSILSADLFASTQDTIYALIAYDLIPKFSASEQGAKLLKAAKRRPPNQPVASFKAGGMQAVRELRSWLGTE